MSQNKFSKIGIVGTGVIGASWAAYYLSRGFDVSATDPAPGAEENLRNLTRSFWEPLGRFGLAKGASLDRLTFDADLGKALAGVEFVQENGPERLDIKRQLLADVSAAIGDDAIIATSSSGILISDIQDAAKNPGRVVLGHPFNPPHLIPLVEVVGGKLTTAETIEQTLAFYTAIGKKPIHIKREIKGHIANRLQAALWREAFYLVDQGVASVSDIDTAIAHGPGLRWALLGPFMNLHLSGGAGGIGHVIDHLGPPIESWWRDLGDLSFTPAVRAEAVSGIEEELKARSLDAMTRARDDVLIQLLSLKSATPTLP
ncbi:3-hydroxyacyl-CoA dehydrogenase NAD-binding domain-containing protein [Labrys monachus]|uniref:3-hydroxyacyl-CoA dehydrogenase n=1 Tax=Labrys monachus TaxID=217067 RepID=A0ABU0FB21_9HYPH|nr:3-hydroxyacyl-CoA dehydrogenase NAD-binding domain-containing protein [Labrys monachus]MDQ0391810.1 3-hydroxyacyl-CoA dehydrogenase [Labrys monachus]